MLLSLHLAVLIVLILNASGTASLSTSLRIIHTNDIHAHLDEFNNKNGLDCRSEVLDGNCVGGIARIRTMVDRIRAADKNTLFFDAGDQFQGTMFYTFFKGEKIAEFMNEIKYDLMCIGNHEFDDGEQLLYKFFRNLTFPVVSSNIDLATTNFIKDIVKPYVIIEKNGLKLGVIGFITQSSQTTTRGAFNISFLDPVKPVQRAVDELHKKGIRKIIGVSHTGYASDIEVARKTHGINLIVGGHSHSLLLHDPTSPGVVGRYPTPVLNLLNQTTYIVQAHRWGDYLGNVLLKWDANDCLISVQGDPILLSQDIPKHEPTATKVAAWRSQFDQLTNRVVCKANKSFTDDCLEIGPCSMADLITDAMLSARSTFGTQLALINSGGIRASFSSGNLRYADFNNALPFGDFLTELTLTGKTIFDMLEAGAALKNQPQRGNHLVNSFPRWSGLKYSINLLNPQFERISDVMIKNATTNLFEPLNLQSSYRIVTNDFVVKGGDSIIFPPLSESVLLDLLLECVVDYASKHSPISPVNDGRLIVIK